MVWIQPLEFEKWFIQVFAGSSTIFVPLAIFMILTLSAFFRMNVLSMVLMVGIFLLMFAGFFESSLIILIAIIGGLLVGWSVSRIVRY